MLSNTITIIDFLSYGSSTSNSSNYKVIATDYNNNSAVLQGDQALEYIKQTYLKGYINNSSLGNDSGILPPGIRIVGENYVVFERPPCYQNVFYNVHRVEEQSEEEDQEENIHLFRIPLPWQVYIATFNKDYYINDVYMFFSNTSLMSRDQELYLPTLPNFYTNALLCRPIFAHMEDIERYPKNLSGVVAGAYDWIWNNGTNNDLNEAMVHLNLQIAKDPEQRKNTIFSKMSDDFYAKLFSSPYGKTYYDSSRVIAMLSAWEKCTIEEIMNYKWPTFSFDKHFESHAYSPTDGLYDYYVQHPDFYDWLNEWSLEYYDGESQENIEYMIENGDYNHDAYYEYVVSSGYIPVDPSKLDNSSKFPSRSLDVAIARMPNTENHYNIKSLFNNNIQKVFALNQNKVASEQ